MCGGVAWGFHSGETEMGNSPYNDLAGTRRAVVQLPVIEANTAPWTANVEMVLLRPTDAVTIESVRVIWPTGITGHAANTKNFNIKTRNSVYGGAAEVANKDFAAGTDVLANANEELWAPTGTAGDIAANGYLTVEVEDVGSGVLCGAPTFIIDYRVQE